MHLCFCSYSACYLENNQCNSYSLLSFYLKGTSYIPLSGEYRQRKHCYEKKHGGDLGLNKEELQLLIAWLNKHSPSQVDFISESGGNQQELLPAAKPTRVQRGQSVYRKKHVE